MIFAMEDATWDRTEKATEAMQSGKLINLFETDHTHH